MFIKLFMGRKVFIGVPRDLGNLGNLPEQSPPVMLQAGPVMNGHRKEHLIAGEKDICNL